MNRPVLPIGAAVLSMVSVQMGAAIAKTLFPLVGPEGVAAVRMGLSAVVFSALFRPWRAFPLGARLWPLIGYGLSLGMMGVIIYWSFTYIPIGVAVAIEVVGPLAVAMLGSRRRVDFLWIGLACCGLLLLGAGAFTGQLDGRGVAFALAAAACWGLYITFGARVTTIGSGRAVALGMTVASLVIVPLGIARAGAHLLVWPVPLLGGVVAVLSSAVPCFLDMVAMRGLPPRLFGVLLSASPAMGALAGWIVLGEALTPLQCLGIGAVMAACAGSSLTSRRAG